MLLNDARHMFVLFMKSRHDFGDYSFPSPLGKTTSQLRKILLNKALKQKL